MASDYVIFTANKVGGGQADCFSNLTHFWWITTAQQLTDVQANAALMGKTIAIKSGTVSDLGSFGRPADSVTAAEFGLQFP